MSTIVMVGNIGDGYTPVGPFESFDAAAAWCDSMGLSTLSSWVMTLVDPSNPHLLGKFVPLPPAPAPADAEQAS